MNHQGLYVIPIKGLTVGSHSFDWIVDGAFFAAYENSEINDAHINVHITVLKHARFMELDFALAGMAEVSCDRCLDPLKLDIELETKMYVHFGNHVSEGDEDDSDVMVLSHDEEQLDIAQFIYEYAHLSLPARRVHPDDKTGKSTCNEYMIQKLNQYLVEEDKGSPASDPRWNNLKNVFDNIKS